MKSHSEFRSILDDFEDLLGDGVRVPRTPGTGGADTETPGVLLQPAAAATTNGEGSRRPASGTVVPDGTEPNAIASPARQLEGDDRKRALEALEAEVQACERCGLHQGRTYAVPGMGVLDPLVMVIGEGPGRQEDRQGLPFVGPAGQYLDKWLASIGLSRRTNVYLGNVVKCRPPGNRDPLPEESAACIPYLERLVDLVRPRIILTVGRISTRILTGTAAGITSIHGNLYTYRGLPLVPTFHPSGVLRNSNWRRPVWEDLKVLRSWLIENTDHTAEPLIGETD